MRKFWNKLLEKLSRVKTLEARKSVAEDLVAASKALFGIFLVSLPGTHHAFAVALAKVMGVEDANLVVSTGTAVGLFIAAFLFRVLAFVLECEYSPESEKQAPKARRKTKRGKSASGERTSDG